MAGAVGSWSITLAKEDFKFSSAHFTVFGATHAEALHGHNYRVQLEISGRQLDELGFLFDILAVKSELRRLCETLDERILLPEQCGHLEVEGSGDSLTVSYADRTYQMPREEVRLLPLSNITIELLAQYVFEQLRPKVAQSAACAELTSMSVTVEETSGQAASYSQDLDE